MYKKIIPIVLGLIIVGGSLYAMEKPSSTFDVKLVNATKNDVQLKFTTQYRRSGALPEGFTAPVFLLFTMAGVSKETQMYPLSEKDVQVNLLRSGDYEYVVTLKPEKALIIQDIQPSDTLYAIGSVLGFSHKVPLNEARDLVNKNKGQQPGPGKDLAIIVITAGYTGYKFDLHYKRVIPRKTEEVKEKGWEVIEEEKVSI